MTGCLKSIAVLAYVSASLPSFCGDWNARLAADYLDARQKEWFAWPAAQAPGGPCLSCHTGMTYLLARPALRHMLREGGPTSYETGLLEGLRARVDSRQPLPSFKKEPVASQALGVEAIFSALFLAANDAGGKMSDATERAFNRMWSLQNRDGQAKGAWAWFALQLDPWEMPDSQYFGAAMALLAAGSTPAEYRQKPQTRQSLDALTAYLREGQHSQPLHNLLLYLWAATTIGDASPELRRSVLNDVWRTQQEDGGWTIDSLGAWKQHPAAPKWAGSNAYATGLVALVLEKAGLRGDPRVDRALEWLKSRQDQEFGYWDAVSMNKVFEPDSMQVKFMRDAATSFAAMALVEAGEARQQKTIDSTNVHTIH